jgi:hypothetical protein
MTERSTILPVTFAGLAALVAGCGDKEAEYPEASASAPVVVSAPPIASSPPPPTTAPCDGVQAAAFTTILLERSKLEAPKMDVEGGTICGVVNDPSGTVNGPTFVLQPGHCYTVLANALPNVTDVDISIVGDASAPGMPPALTQLLAQPLAVESQAGAAAKIECFKWAWPLPVGAKVVLKSKAGTGPMGAQVFRKKTQ